MTTSTEKTELDRLKRVVTRATLQRNTTIVKIRKIHKFITESANIEDPNVSDQIRESASMLDSLWMAFEAANEAVLDSLIAVNSESDYSCDLPAEILGLINSAKAMAKRCNTESEKSDSFSGQQNGENRTCRPTSRLPEIPLPIFKGDFSYWPTFRDRFSALVHGREDMSKIDKMYYLIGCLQGSAADAIRGIPVTADNYDLAWSMLSTRFNRPRLVATSLITKLLTAPVSSQESLGDLNKFISTFDESISLLNALEIPDLGSFIMFSLAFRCLPSSTRKLFEASGPPKFPSVNDLLQFVQSRMAILEIAGDTRKPLDQPRFSQQGVGTSRKNKQSEIHFASLAVSKPLNEQAETCPCCSGNHSIGSCGKFESWPVGQRHNFAREHKLCYTCLSNKHWANKCRAKTRCETCAKKHHSLLHGAAQPRQPSGSTANNDTSLCASALSSRCSSPTAVLLGTALVHVCDRSGTWQTARALVDSASQISAITVACSTRLGLRPIKWTAPISGLSGTQVLDVRGMVDCTVQPRFSSEPQLKVKAWVLPTITSSMPRKSLSTDIKDAYADLALADPTFNISAPIDLLLGADWFSTILDGRKLVLNEKLPTAFSSIFGWVLIGPVLQSTVDHVVSCPVALTVSLENLLEKFWRIEEPTVAPLSFTEDGQCEEVYQAKGKRLSSGRFSVPLPTRTSISQMNFPGSREHALRRFEGLEKKLASDSKLRSLYISFMSDYRSLGHMSIAKSPGKYFIPHHAVCKSDNSETKIRVVFDASARSSAGTSLNDCLFQGPKLQQDIVDVLIRFRVPEFVFTADICKMYRQILVLPEYRSLQHIFWRDSPNDMLSEYELNTVTYGVNCAPFLALRVLKSIALNDCSDSTAVRDALLQQTYVDDVCTGADSVTEVLQLQADLIAILGRAGLELKKWSSNTSAILEAVPIDHRVNSPMPFDTENDSGTKVLGIRWHPTEDYFSCALRLDSSAVHTKRGLLSVIASIFDPLGLFAPATFYGKCIMQRTWVSKTSWDDPLPADIQLEWSSYVNELQSLGSITIPRHFGSCRGAPCLLLGFCDASQFGYAAVVYLKLLNSSSKTSTCLIGTKTKLAPIKQLTIPRLELNAALLLAKWMSRIQAILEPQLNVIDVFAWSDSSIVLSWLTNPHESFKIYVSNRAHQICSLLPTCTWLHVRSDQNPADCASRGVMPAELSNLSLYWHGPDFIRCDPSSWTDTTTVMVIPVCELPEVRPTTLVIVPENPLEWFYTYSSFDRLVRVVARVFRFFNKCRRGSVRAYPIPLQHDEIEESVKHLVIASQKCHFAALLNELSSGRPVSSKSLSRLHPFLDDSCVIRVGGRLRNSNLSYGCKHPILLAKKSHLAWLVCRRWHKLTCHAGPRIMAALISRQFWIISIKSVLHKITRQCSICVRFDAKPPQPLMADLPAARVQPSRPFAKVGIDFAGPLQMREVRLRKSRTYKVYIAVFICFSVKAVHLEVVTELSTEAFLASFDRFVARRGLPSDVFSDCGTNFIGADKQLQKVINSPSGQIALAESQPLCQWHFNPPSAPHFGGLWEAAVRSTKRLLIRTMGTHIFTYEEFTTLTARVEAVLNSRPLTPLTTDPTDFDYLSPGHFLIGQPLLAVPPRVLVDEKVNMTTRWKMLDQCHQTFWRRWSTEYLTTLQERSKWTNSVPNINVNDMVVIIDNQAPPLAWRLGRVSELLPGNDGVVRVVRLQTQQGQMIRPVTKLVVLPTQGGSTTPDPHAG